MIPAGLLLIASEFFRSHDPLRDAARGSAAGLVAMVPGPARAEAGRGQGAAGGRARGCDVWRGVNDVQALKQADLGIAMGSGSQASRSVARVVLLNGTFAAIPPMPAEGRRVVANIERVAGLFVTTTVYAAILAVVVGVAGSPTRSSPGT